MFVPLWVLSHPSLEPELDLLSIRGDGNGTVPISGFKKAWQLPLVCSYHVRSPVTLLVMVHLERPWRISSHRKRTHKKVNKVPDV